MLRLWGWFRGAGAWWVSVGAVVVLGVSGCAGPGSGGAASPSPSSTGIPKDVKVCGFLSPSETEGALDYKVGKMIYYHFPGYGLEDEYDPAKTVLGCAIFPSSNDNPQVSMWYEPNGVIHRVMPAGPTDPIPVFDDAKAMEGAVEFTIDGVEGEGLTLLDERKSVAMWHYPDDHVLIVRMTFYDSDDATDYTEQAKALVEASVSGVVEQASKPRQEFTGYPLDSAPPGMEYATPNPG